MSDIEKIESNWQMFEKLLTRLSDDNINKMLDELGERIVMTPGSTNSDQYGCFPGGLVQHSLDVTKTMRNLSESLSLGVETKSILKVGLLHDIGKVGSLTEPLYEEQDSDWHREKLGQMYKYNENLERMSTSHRTLWLLQNFGVTLTNDEWLAVQLAQGSHFEENRFYVGHEPTLAKLLQNAKSFVVHLSRTNS